ISNGASGIQALDPKGPHSFFFILAAHQNLASKIFSSCCKCCEKPDAADDAKIPNQTQELQLLKHGRYQARMPCPASGDLILLIPLLLGCPQISFSCVQKDELNRQSLKHSDAAPCMSMGKATLPSEKTTSCFSSSEYGEFETGALTLTGNLLEYQHVPDREWRWGGGGHMTYRLFQNLILNRDGGDRNSPSRPKAESSLSVLPFLLSDVNLQVSKRGFHKRRLSRYSQDHWPYQPCLIGRP
ncbi:testis-expressed protein 48, partial [Bos indicus x Bos taurus]|uniref:testis-expressed protein 48 n=1 Tax=Bos indicus x Bos taurus TaxID=30522 RepID=UPI000F7D184A